jgi:hypothetical protein
MYCNISIVLLVATHGQFPSGIKGVVLITFGPGKNKENESCGGPSGGKCQTRVARPPSHSLSSPPLSPLGARKRKRKWLKKSNSKPRLDSPRGDAAAERDAAAHPSPPIPSPLPLRAGRPLPPFLRPPDPPPATAAPTLSTGRAERRSVPGLVFCCCW